MFLPSEFFTDDPPLLPISLEPKPDFKMKNNIIRPPSDFLGNDTDNYKGDKSSRIKGTDKSKLKISFNEQSPSIHIEDLES